MVGTCCHDAKGITYEKNVTYSSLFFSSTITGAMVAVVRLLALTLGSWPRDESQVTSTTNAPKIAKIQLAVA